VTIQQLLNHTSGIPNYMNMREHSMDELSREFGTLVIDKIAFAKKYCSSDLEFEPGTKWNYNNSAYFLLGLVVEQITGKSFEAAMRELIFNPLKMTNSGDLQPDPEQVVPNLASGYLKNGPDFRHMTYWNLSTAYCAGSLYSTLDDLVKYDQALYSSTFLSDQAKSLMFTPGLNGYGCGWELRDSPIGSQSEVKRIQTHEGFLFAWHTRIYRIPADGYLVVILSNTGDSPLEKMFTGITDILYGRTPAFPKPSLRLAVEKKYKSSGIAEAISYGKSLLATNGNEWDKADTELNGFGYQLLRIGAIEDAVRVFRWNTELHPDSWNVWDSLGEGLANAGDKAAAIAAYQKSIDLNSENKAGIEMVKKLKAN
jgi:CubicO group peptidase (beta-lactamase class C family)